MRLSSDRTAMGRAVLSLVDDSRPAAEIHDSRKTPNLAAGNVESVTGHIMKLTTSQTVSDARDMVRDASGRLRVLGQDTVAKEFDAMATKLDTIISEQDSTAASSWRCKVGLHPYGAWRSESVIGRTKSIAAPLDSFKWYALSIRTCTRCGRLQPRETEIVSNVKVVCTAK